MITVVINIVIATLLYFIYLETGLATAITVALIIFIIIVNTRKIITVDVEHTKIHRDLIHTIKLIHKEHNKD